MADLFSEGGPHRIRKTGQHEFEMKIALPADDRGMIGRECPGKCSPAYFKIKPGTGVSGEQEAMYCPYCRHSANPNDFHTEEQAEFAKNTMINEARRGLNTMLRDSLGLGSSGKKRLGGGMFSIEMSMQPIAARHVPRPIEEELRRDVTCPTCTLEHSVFGLAVWCPDCGSDLFMEHVAQELHLVRRILAAVPARQDQLGPRAAARDIENCLEDLVSIYETVLKLICRFHLRASGTSDDDVSQLLEIRIKNKFQNIELGSAAFRELVGRDILDEESPDTLTQLKAIFEKRHPITHNLGIIDRKYLKRVESGELVGREVRVSISEVGEATDVVERVLRHAYQP